MSKSDEFYRNLMGQSSESSNSGTQKSDEFYRNLMGGVSSDNINKVNDWIDRYNSVVKGVSDYNSSRNGRYISDISGGYRTEIDALIGEYEQVKGLAYGYHLREAHEQLKKLQSWIQEGNKTENKVVPGSPLIFGQYAQHSDVEKALNPDVAGAKQYSEKLIQEREARRATTRDSASIQKELDDVNAQLQEAYKPVKRQEVFDTLGAIASNVMASSSGFATPVPHGAQITPEIAALEQRKKELEEEQGWAQYFADEKYQQDSAGWAQKYAGQSYDQLTGEAARAELAGDAQRAEWLRGYAGSIMTDQDRQTVIEKNENEIAVLEAVLEEYAIVSEQSKGGLQSAIDREKQLKQLYGSQVDVQRQIDALLNENWELGNEIAYGKVDQNQDFEKKSGYVKGKDQLYEYINKNPAFGESRFFQDIKEHPEINPWAKFDEMKKDEVAVYNYLYATEGKKQAENYLEYLSYTLNARKMEKFKKKTAENATGFFNGAIGSIVSFPLTLMGIAGIADATIQKLGNDIHYAATGEYAGPVDYNRAAMMPSVAASTIRNTVSGNIAKHTGTINLDRNKYPVLSKVLNGKSLGDVYQLGMSMVDSAAVAALSTVTGPAAFTLLGGSAGTQGMLDAVANGATDQQALTMGVLNGAFEMIFEKVSIDKLLNGSSGNIVKDILTQGITEGSEEAFTSIANTVADIVVMAEKSDWEKGIAAYMEQGMSREEAETQAFWDVAIQIGWDFVGGMLSGGIMGGGSYAIDSARQRKIDAQLQHVKEMLESQTPVNPVAEQTQQQVEQQAARDDLPEFSDVVMRQVIENMGGPLETKEQSTAVQNVERVSLENVDITAPVSVAEQIRQQRAAVQQNEGGINNVRTAENAELSQSNTDTGAGVLYGSSQRNDSTSTAEQAGILEDGAGQTAAGKNTILEQYKQASARQSLAKTLRLPRISTAALGVETGTNAPAVYELPREHWDAGLQNTASRIKQETGKTVRFVVGKLLVKGGTAQGVISGGQIIVQCDNLKYTADQIADHEAFHDKVDRARVDNHTNIVAQLRKKLLEALSQEQLQKKLEQYAEALEGYLDPNMTNDPAACEEVWERILEELMADAYSGINWRGIGATQYTDVVNQYMAENGLGKGQIQENGTRQTNGPPATLERYSAGEQSNFSDVVMGQIMEHWGGSATDTQITTEKENTAEVGSVDQKMNNGYIPGVVSESEIESNIKTIAKMESVTTIRGDEFKMGDGKLLVDVTNFFESIGGSVYNDRLGDIYLRKRGVKDDLGHGMSDEKAASFAAIPAVLQYGKVAGYVGNYEGRGYDSATVVAPITIGQEPYMMGVIVHRSNGENRFYVHDVVAIKEEVVPLITGTPKKGKSGGTTSTISIIKKILDVKRKNEGKSDIRYSWDGEENVQETGLPEQATKELMEAIQSMSGKDIMNDEKLRAIITQYTQDTTPAPRPQTYKVDRGNLKKALSSELGLTKEQKEQLTGILNRYAETGKPPKREPKKAKTGPKADTDIQVKATTSIRNLKHSLRSMFSIPAGSRAEINSYIDRFAQRIIANEKLTNEDRQEFFRTMYEAGMMEVEADAIYAEGRSYMTSGRIYVNESLRRSLGDRWNELRQRAFAAGVYLTTDPNNGAGVDVWNQDLARQVPGLFDENETDMEVALERLIQVAEEGRSEMVSLPEYTAQLAKQEHIPVSEILDTMEQQLDYALRVFSESAGVELDVKKVAERQKAKERQAHREAAERARDARELREAKQKALSALKWLARNRKKAPSELQGKIDEILGDIDVMAVSAAKATNWDMRYGDTWRNLVDMYKSVKDKNSPNYDPNFTPSQHLENMMKRLDGMHLADMTPDVGTIRELYNFAVNLQTEIQNKNKFLKDEKNRQIGELFRSIRSELKDSKVEESDNFLGKLFHEKQLTPMNMLQRMVGWNPDSVLMEAARQFDVGARAVRQYMLDAKMMLAEFNEEHKGWLKTADGQGKSGVWYDVEVQELKDWDFRDGATYGKTVTVSMTPLQKVHLYLESQNYANLDHMKYGGRRFADKELYREGKRKKAFDKGVTVKLSPETVRKITSDLTEEEMALAKILEKYYNQYAPEKMNAMSNVIYGYDIATEGSYAPIWVKKETVEKDIAEAKDGKAINAGSMQARIHGTNPTYNVSCIEAVEKHIQDTAYAVGMAIPTENWRKLLNYKPDIGDSGSENLRGIIGEGYGSSGETLIENLLVELQGKSNEDAGGAEWINKIHSVQIGSAFAFNVKIMAKQLGSIGMAAPYLDAKYFPSPKQIAKIDEELIGKYTPDLAWRGLGYSVPEVKQLMEAPNKFQELAQKNKATKFILAGGQITAADSWSASILWPWAENNVRKNFPDLEIGTQEQIDNGESPFYKKVAELFNDAVARSQSTSEDLYQSALRKSKNPIVRTFTLFKSDSAQSYNMLRQKFGEMQYYKRTGDAEGLKKARRMLGQAVLSTVANNLWAAGVDMVIAALVFGGKGYKDEEEDRYTWESVLSKVGRDFAESLFGVVMYGEEIASAIGKVLAGEKFYDIETPGIEQLNDIVKTVADAMGTVRDFTAEASEIAKNGGDVGAYIKKERGVLVDAGVKMAEMIATYYGVPVNNVKKYLLQPIGGLIPGLTEMIEDFMETPEKADLSGLEGAALESRLENVLAGRNVEVSGDSIEALSTLYTAGMKDAIPSGTPDSISFDNTSHKLGAHQQQTYDFIWGDIVSGALDDIVSSEQFASADDETKQKMLKRLYDYASAQARSVLFPEYVKEKGILDTEIIIKAGVSVSDALLWKSEIDDMKQPEKFETLLDRPWSDSEKQAVIGTLMDNELKTESGEPTEYAKFLELIEEGVSVEQYLQIRLSDVNTDNALEMAEGGLDGEDIVEYVEMLGDVDLEPGEDSATDLQKWRVCVDFSDNVSIQLSALSAVMGDAQYQKMEMAYVLGIEPKDYVAFYEVKPKFDADKNGGFTNAEIKAAIDSIGGSLTNEQKAVLWQLGTGSKSTKNNPYDRSAGQWYLDAKAAAKEEGTKEVSISDAFSAEIAKQLAGG